MNNKNFIKIKNRIHKCLSLFIINSLNTNSKLFYNNNCNNNNHHNCKMNNKTKKNLQNKVKSFYKISF